MAKSLATITPETRRHERGLQRRLEVTRRVLAALNGKSTTRRGGRRRMEI
jgi:hypothetical protein